MHMELWLTLVRPRRLEHSLLHGLLAIRHLYCGVWACVWFLSGVLWVLLLACSTLMSSREGAGQFLGDSPLGYPGKSPLREVLSPAQITPMYRESDGGFSSPLSLSSPKLKGQL